jgi:hypothetical protein
VDDERAGAQQPGRSSDETDDPADDAMMVRLGALFEQHDAPPDLAIRLAEQSFGLRSVDAELAALVADSAVDEALIGVRGHDGPWDRAAPRLLTFEAGDLALEIAVERQNGRRRLLGQLLPAAPARIEVRQPSVVASRWSDADERGRFTVEDVVPGPISVTCHRDGHPAITTEWTAVE